MSDIIKTMLHESEPQSLEILHNALDRNFPEVKVIDFKPSHVDQEKINQDVDVIFYEVKTQNDIDELKLLSNHGYSIVVITNNESLIKELFKIDVIAFIVPPFDDHNLRKVMEKIKKLSLLEHITFKTESLLHLSALKKSETILIPTNEGFEVIRINEIIRLEADRSYCNIYLTSGRTLVVSKPLRDIETLLPNDLFFRSHQSHLFNVNAMQRFIKSDGGYAVMTDQSHVPLSKNKKEELVLFMGRR